MTAPLAIGIVIEVEVGLSDVRIGQVITDASYKNGDRHRIGIARSGQGNFVIYSWDTIRILSDKEAMLWKLENA